MKNHYKKPEIEILVTFEDVITKSNDIVGNDIFNNNAGDPFGL